MYETREHKETTSRTLSFPIRKCMQHMRHVDNRKNRMTISNYFSKQQSLGDTKIKSSVVQYARSIGAYNTLTGTNTTASSSKNPPENYDDFDFLFKNITPWYYPKEGINGPPSSNYLGKTYYKREPYFCAEPHALLALWKTDKNKIKGKNISQENWLLNVNFPEYASGNDEIFNDTKKEPCEVCRQWIDCKLPMKVKPELVPAKETLYKTKKQIEAQNALKKWEEQQKIIIIEPYQGQFSVFKARPGNSDDVRNDTSSSDTADSESKENGDGIPFRMFPDFEEMDFPNFELFPKFGLFIYLKDWFKHKNSGR